MVDAICLGSETDGCGAGFGKIRVYEGGAEDGCGGGGCGDSVAGVADWVVGQEDDGGYVGGGRCGWMTVSCVVLLGLRQRWLGAE